MFQVPPGTEPQQRRRGPRQKGGVNALGDSCQAPQEIHVRAALIELEVADTAAITLAAEDAVFVIVQPLEKGTSRPFSPLVDPDPRPELVLGEVEHLELEELVGLGVHDEVLQASPGLLESQK